MTTLDNREKFALFIKSKEVATWLSEFPVEGTKASYASALFRYWNESLSKTHHPTWDWRLAVKAQRKSDDMMTRKGWALEVLELHENAEGPGQSSYSHCLEGTCRLQS